MIVDFHSHILPYIDDGAKDWDEFLRMAQLAIAEGVTDMVCTPHFIPGELEFTKETYYSLLAKAKNKLNAHGLRLNLIPGSEVFFTPDLFPLLENGKLITINKGERYLLIEFPLLDLPINVEHIIDDIRSRGITPIIAHPERNLVFGKKPNILVKLIDQGVLCQLNVGSIIGGYGGEVKKTAEIFLKSRMIHLLGSDIHSSKGTNFQLENGLAVVEKLVGVKQAIELKKVNPLKIISGCELKPYPVDFYANNKSFWSFFFHRKEEES